MEFELDLGHAKDGGRVYADVKLADREGMPRLSISFDHTSRGMKRHGRGTSYGQLSDVEFEPGTLGYQVRFVWKGYHLNDFHSGCEHQRAASWETEGYDSHRSEPCPVCGYQFGSAWNTVPVPDEVIALVKSWQDKATEDADNSDNSDWAREGIKLGYEPGAAANPSFPEADAWTVKLTYQGRTMTLPFYKGKGHAGKPPELHEVMSALFSDAGAIDEVDGDFEQWRSELGFDQNEASAKRIFQASVRATARLKKLLGDQYDRLMSEQEG